MKLAFIIVFAVLFNVNVAKQIRRDVLKENHRRGSELAHEIYAKRDVANGAAISILPRPYYPPYYGGQYQCELCCNGKRLNGQFPLSVSCCGNTVVDSNTALCCGNTSVSFPPSQDSYQWQCCGNSARYNTSSQLCCGNTVFDKAALEQCCGNNKFDASINICCGNSVLSKPTYSTWSCCGNQNYDTTVNQCSNGNIVSLAPGVQNYQCGSQTIDFGKQICCNNTAVTRGSNYTLCCGSLGYQADQQACCGGKIYPSNNYTQSCCGSQQIDITTQTCCNNVAVNTPTGKNCNSFYCCGTQLYDSSSQTSLCCNDQINNIISTTNGPAISGPVPPGSVSAGPAIIMPPNPNSYQCCGSKAYNPQTDTCCSQDSNSNVISGQNSNCCGLQTYDSSKSTCCNNTLYDIGNVPLDTCCCPNGGCNNYIRYPPYPIMY